MKSLVVLLLPILLAACGGGGGGGGDASVSPGGNEGSVDATTGIVTPKLITVTPYSGSVLTETSYYTINGLTPSTNYDIHLSSVSADVSLLTSSSSDFLGTYCNSNRAGTLSEACGVQSSATGEIYFEVGGSASATVDATFTVTVLDAAVNEGMATSPVDITDAVPYEGSVADAGNSYYVISGLIPGQHYDVAVSNLVYQASLRTFPHQDLSAPITADAAACAIDNPNWEDETCTQAANFEGKLYIQVDNINSGVNQDGSHFSLSVTLGTGTVEYFEGYQNAPIVLSSMTYNGTAYGYSSYYQVTGLSAGIRYEVHYNNATADGTSLNVSTGGDNGGTSCFLGPTSLANFDKWCVAAATESGNLFIEVAGAYDTPTAFDLEINLAPVAEGSELSPVSISMPYNGQVDNIASYYVVSGLTANWNYEVLPSNPTRPITTTTGTSFAALGSSSTGKTNGAGELYIKVSGNLTSGDGAWFSLDIREANNPQGSISAPLDISGTSETTPQNGQVDDTSSYYVISGLIAGKNYMTHLNNIVISSVSTVVFGSINVYSDNSFLPAAMLCTTGSTILLDEEGHCLAPANLGGELYLKVSASWDATGSTYNLWTVVSEHDSEGETALPTDIDPTLVIDGGAPLTYNAQVSTYGNAVSYYKVALTSGPANYTVSLSNLTGDVNLEVWNAITGSTDTCRSMRDHLLDESCVITSETGGPSDLYIKVSVDTNSDHWDGAGYDVTVTPGGATPVVEGTTVTPLDISASLPYSGKTADSALNYYVVSGLTTTARYEISNSNDILGLTTNVYSEAANTTLLCEARSNAKNHSASKRIACQTSPNASGELYISVSSDGALASSDAFVLSVSPAPTPEGSLGTPQTIVGAGTRASQVNGPVDGSGNYSANTVNSYYHMSGLTPGSVYSAQVSKDTETVNLFVYDDAGFSTALCNTDTFTTQCEFTANGAGDVYIHADGYVSTTRSGSFFDLSVVAAPVAEGSLVSPMVVTAGINYSGQHGGVLNDSYYKVSGLVPNSTHRILISDTTAETAIYLYGHSAMLYKTCATTLADVPDGCSAAANAAGEIFFKVGTDFSSPPGANFNVIVTP